MRQFVADLRMGPECYRYRAGGISVQGVELMRLGGRERDRQPGEECKAPAGSLVLYLKASGV